MKRFLLRWSLYALVVGSLIYGFSWLNAHQPGYLLISYANTSIETTVWVAVLIALTTLWLLNFIYRTIRGSWRITRGAASYLTHGGEQKAQIRTHRGLVAFMEGNWQQARRNLIKSASKSPLPLVNYLAAARCAYELNERDQALELLHQAEEIAPDRKLAVTLTQARMQLLGKEYESCIATLQRAKNTAANHPVVLDLLYQVYLAVNDWAAIGDLLPELRKQKILSAEKLDIVERDVHRSLIAFAGEKAKRGGAALETLQQQWDQVPAKLKKDAQLVRDYCEQLRMNSCDQESEELLQQTLKRHWHDDLILLYGQVQGADIARQLLLAEGWLKSRPNSSALMLTLGRLCLRNELWGKAREYFEQSIEQQATPQAYAELARLLAHLDEHRLSTQYYQQGLLLSAPDLPALPLP